MDEKQLKTSLKQRIIIIVVALLLLGSTVLTYMFIVMQSGLGKQSLASLEEQYNAKQAELKAAAQPLSDQYFDEFKGYYQNRVKSYNAANANSEKLKIEDIKVGTGRELTDDDTNYQAFYIGWCADGSIFDSSFDYATDDTEKETPTGLTAPLIGSSSMIEGWLTGIVGMKIGGVRQLTIPGEMAYGDTRDDICEGKNAPLKFIVMPLEQDAEIVRLSQEAQDLQIKVYTALLQQQGQ